MENVQEEFITKIEKIINESIKDFNANSLSKAIEEKNLLEVIMISSNIDVASLESVKDIINNLNDENKKEVYKDKVNRLIGIANQGVVIEDIRNKMTSALNSLDEEKLKDVEKYINDKTNQGILYNEEIINIFKTDLEKVKSEIEKRKNNINSNGNESENNNQEQHEENNYDLNQKIEKINNLFSEVFSGNKINYPVLYSLDSYIQDLPDCEQKKDFIEKFKDLKQSITLLVALDRIKKTDKEDVLARVQRKVNLLEDEEYKKIVQTKLNNVKKYFDDLKKAIKAVEKAEETKNEEDIRKARKAVYNLEPGEKKDELTERINAIRRELGSNENNHENGSENTSNEGENEGNNQEEEEIEEVEVTDNKPSLSWKTVVSVAAGVGIGAGVVFLTGPAGAIAIGVAGLVANLLIKDKLKIPEQQRLDGLKNVEMIENPRNLKEKLHNKIAKAKIKLNTDEVLKNMRCGVNAAIVSGAVASVAVNPLGPVSLYVGG